MIYPPLNTLIEITDSRYALVVGLAKRARSIVDGTQPLVEVAEHQKPVSIAVDELFQEKIEIIPANPCDCIE